MTKDAEIERATAADYAAAVEVLIRSRHASVPSIPPPAHSDEEIRDHFILRAFPSSATWIARRDRSIVAVMVCSAGWIEQLYVDPQHTGAGLGGRLVEAAKADADRLELWTFASNEGARRFYERHGFVVVGGSDGDNEEGAPDLHYRWDRRARPSPQPPAPATASSPSPTRSLGTPKRSR